MLQKPAQTVITLLHIAFFAACGFLSAFVFYSFEEELFAMLFPGLLYTGVTILVFIINRIRIKPDYALLYFILMTLLYMAVFSITMMLYILFYILGPIFCGAGAIASFELTSRFITKINYNSTAVFFTGALGFASNEILLIGPIANFIKPVYLINDSFNSLFALSFLFWQLFVGTKLYFTLRKNRWQQSN